MTCGVHAVDTNISFEICGVSEDRHIIFCQGGEKLQIGEYPQEVASLNIHNVSMRTYLQIFIVYDFN